MGSVRGQGVDDSHPSAMQRSIKHLRDLFLGRHGDQQDRSRPAKGKALGSGSGARAAVIASQSVSALGEHGVPFPAMDKSPSSVSKGAPSKEPAAPGPLAPRDDVVDLIPNRKSSCRFAFGTACDPKRCSYVHDRFPAGYYRDVERQRLKVSPLSDEPRALKHAREELPGLRVMCYGDRSQPPSATPGGADCERLPVEGDVDTDTTAGTTRRGASTRFCRRSRSSTEGAPWRNWNHLTPRPRETLAPPTPLRPGDWSTSCG